MTATITEKVSFNLLDRPWIPVTTVKGAACNVTLLDIGRQAQSYLSIGHPDPLVTVAVHRFILAFLHRALDGPKTSREAAKWYREGFPIAPIEAYAEKWRERFDLFSPDRPFLQQPGIERAPFEDHWTRLSAARGSFNTNVLFRPELRSKAEPDGDISPAEAVLELLAHQGFTLGGLIKRFVTSAKGSPVATSALTVVTGGNLLQTLCLNLVPYGSEQRHGRNDTPVWERDLPTVAALEKGVEYPINGLTTNYVWPARSILLRPDPSGRVEKMYYAGGVPPAEGSRYPDPMLTTVKNAKGEPYPMAYREGKSMWRDLHSFVPRHNEDSGPPVINHATELLNSLDYFDTHLFLAFAVYGMVNNKAKIALVRQEALRLPAAVLNNPDLADNLQVWVKEVDSGAFRLKVALQVMARALISSGENCDPKDVNAQVAAFQFEGRFWPAAETKFWTFINGLSADPDAFRAQYDVKVDEWTKSVNKLVRDTYDDIARSLGRSAKTLRAIERGRMNLRKGFKKAHDSNNTDS
jgi:CRISPR system Cascade subunit CasA